MKKIVLGIVMILVSIPLVVFGLTDTEAPIIKSISVDKSKFYQGDTLTYTIEAEDDISGISHIDIEMHKKNDHSKYIALQGDVSGNGTITYTRQIPENSEPGDYEYFAIQVWDGAGNLRTYYSGSEDFPIKNLEATILSNGKDYTAPTLSNFSVSTNQTTYPNNFEFSVDAVDNESGIKYIYVNYLINGKEYTYQLDQNGNRYSKKITVDENGIYTDAQFISVYAYDNAGNVVKVITHEGRDNTGGIQNKIAANLDVTFTNKIIDNEDPKLNGYSYSSYQVTTPGYVTFSFDITDDTAIGNVQANLKGYDKDGKLIDNWIMYVRYDQTKKTYTTSMTFDQYYPDSEFFMESVEITDASGKKVTYKIGDESHPLEKKILTLIEGTKSENTSSTIKSDYITKIEELADGESITIDATSNHKVEKKAFDAISGTNKKITILDDGIEWIFNGQDIINETKDINTKIKVYKINGSGEEDFSNLFDEGTDAIVVEFQNNGTLPGKCLVRIKADYSLRNYIGVENLKVYYYGENEELEAIATELRLNENGYYEFYISHNSKYIISKKNAKQNVVIKDSISLLGNDELVETSLEEMQTETSDDSQIVIENQEIDYKLIAICLLIGTIVTTGGVIIGNQMNKKRKTK